MRVGEHFDSSEFACHDGCGFEVPHPDLVRRLERLRKAKDARPITVVSGCRCCPHNAAVKGKARSQHTRGKAADLEPGYCTLAEARAAGFTGVGTKGKWAVHVDVREGSFTTWRY